MNPDAPGSDTPSDAKPGRGALADRPLVRAVLVLFSGDAISQVLLVLIAPIITRIYSPDEFGVATAYGAALAVVVVISALRYELAVPVPVDDEAANVLGAGFVSAASMGLLGLGLYLVLASFVDAVGDGLPLSVALLFGLAVLLNGALIALGGWMIRRQTYAVLARSRIVRTVCQATLQIALGWAGLGAVGLIVAAVSGTGIGLAILVISFLRRDRASIDAMKWPLIRIAFKRYRRFPLLSGSAAFVQTVNVEIPYVVFGGRYTQADVGAMGLSRRALGAPISTISRSVGQVFFGRGAELVRTAPENLYAFVRRMTMVMAAVFVPLGVAAFVVAPPLTTFVFGDDWADAADFMRVMIPMFVFSAIANPTGYVLHILERQDLHLIRDLVRLAIGLVAIGLVLAANWSAVDAMLVYVLFACLGSIVYVATSLTAVRRHEPTSGTSPTSGV